MLAGPGMYLLHKYTQYKRTHQESQRKKATEKELQCLHLKIVSTASKHFAHYSSKTFLLAKASYCLGFLCKRGVQRNI